MADESNPTVGYCDCAYCGEVAIIKKNVKGKLYVNCQDHPLQHLHTKSGQDWILNHMRETRERPPAAPTDPPAPVVEDEPAPAPVVDPPQPAPPAPRPRAKAKPAPSKAKAGGFFRDIEDW